MEHMETKNSLDSELQILSICSVKILSRKLSKSTFWFWRRVLTISTGMDAIVVTKPEIMAATKWSLIPSCIPIILFALSFACEYVPNWAAFTTIARAMVGVAPRHSVVTPSSLLKIYSQNPICLHALFSTFRQNVTKFQNVTKIWTYKIRCFEGTKVTNFTNRQEFFRLFTVIFAF